MGRGHALHVEGNAHTCEQEGGVSPPPSPPCLRVHPPCHVYPPPPHLHARVPIMCMPPLPFMCACPLPLPIWMCVPPGGPFTCTPHWLCTTPPHLTHTAHFTCGQGNRAGHVGPAGYLHMHRVMHVVSTCQHVGRCTWHSPVGTQGVVHKGRALKERVSLLG